MNIYKLPENTLMERIRHHYLNDYEISDKDEEIRKRWESAYAMILEKKPDAETAKLLSKMYGITLQRAYIDISNAKSLFGDVHKSGKDALRNLVSQWAIELLKAATEEKDYGAAAKALEKIIKANNLDKEDQDLPDPSKIQPPVQLLSVNFNFINSPFFREIDPQAQAGLMELYNRIMAMIENSPMKDYLGVIQRSLDQPMLPDGD